MLSIKAREKLKQVRDYSICKCDYIIDAYEEKDKLNSYLTIQRANKSKLPYRLLDDLKPLTFKI